MNMENENTPGSGTETGGAGVHDKSHSNFIPETIPDVVSETDQKDLSHVGRTLEAVQFLQAWAENGPWVLTAIAPDGGKITTTTFEAGKQSEMRDWIEERQGRRNIYFTVNPVIRPVLSKPKKTDMRGMQWLHVDVDPRPGEKLESERVRALKLLREFEPKPTVIINSGGGYQGFWMLDMEHETSGDEAKAAEMEAYNLNIETMLQGDACHNIDRIMRLPGTINVPGKKKRERGRKAALASVVEVDWARVYPLSAFKAAEKLGAQIIPLSKVDLSADLPQIALDDLPPSVSSRTKMLIVNGDDPDDPIKYPSRSEVLFAVLCEMVRADVPDDVIAACVMDRDHAISGHVRDQRRPMPYLERQIQRAKTEAHEPELAEMNATHAVVKYGGRVRILVERSDGLPEFLKKGELFDWHANRTVTVGTDKQGNDIKKTLAEWWMRHPLRRDFERVEFQPRIDTPPNIYNLWRGPAVIPSQGDSGLFLELIHEVVAAGDEAVSEYILNWMALKFQRPGAKLETSIALRGGQGIGKSLFAELFGELFGRHFVAVSDQKGLMGNFNAHLQQALLVFADEIAAATNTNMVGRLKTLVTQSHIRIEPKGVDSFSAPNHFAVILASNSPHIVATDADDRRWVVLDVSSARRGDRIFFHDLVAQWRNGGREAFALFLMQRDLSSFEHRDRPQTAAHSEQVEHSFTGAAHVIHEMLASGETPQVFRNDGPHNVPFEGNRVFIPSSDLAKAALKNGQAGRGDVGGFERSLGHMLKKLARVKKTERISISGKSARGVWLPKLDVSRKWWSEMHGRDFEWDAEAGENWDVIPVPSAQAWNAEMPF